MDIGPKRKLLQQSVVVKRVMFSDEDITDTENDTPLNDEQIDEPVGDSNEKVT